MKEKLRVLVVEDEEPVADLIAVLLARQGWEVQVARTGWQGLQLAIEERFDLITLDIGLPDLSGLEICRELRQRHISYRTPVVFVSAHGGEDVRRQALGFEAADFIQKPFRAEELLARISTAVNRNGSLPEALEEGAAST